MYGGKRQSERTERGAIMGRGRGKKKMKMVEK